MKTIPRVRLFSSLLHMVLLTGLLAACQQGQLPDADGDGIPDADDTDVTNPPVEPPTAPPGTPPITDGTPARACKEWSRPYEVGSVDTDFVHEASGLEWSSAFPERLYHNNDSGDGPYVYVSDKKGANMRKVKLSGVKNRDAEDMALGPCPDGNGQCLVFGDIGDGSGGDPILTFVRESELSKSTANVMSSVTLKLETGDVDIEALGLHPNGDVFLATKDYERHTTRIMHVPRSALMLKSTQAKLVGRIDLSKFDFKGEDDLVTGMDIAPDGKSFILLTYGAVLEVVADLGMIAAEFPAKGVQELQERTHYVGVEKLGQQEAIAYVDGGDSFIYDTEDRSEAPLMRVDCLKR